MHKFLEKYCAKTSFGLFAPSLIDVI